MSATKQLLAEFLDLARQHNTGVPPIKVAITNTFSISRANVLVRTAADLGKRYFFGLNYLNAEELFHLDNSFIAFICGSVDRIIFLPASKLMELLPRLSHDRNGEYKINFTRNLEIVLNGRGNRFDSTPYIGNWQLLSHSSDKSVGIANPLDSVHSLIQGRLLEVGRLRKFDTFCPNKSWTFNGQRLDSLRTLQECPRLQFTDHESLRQIDVMWFRKTNGDYYPEFAFEVELSTGVWSGFGRLATLREFNTKLTVVSNDSKKFQQVRASFPDLRHKCILVQPEKVGLLYSAEVNLIRLREEFHL